MPEGMIQPGGRRPADPPPGLGRVAPYEPAQTAVVCPVCETDQFTRLDLAGGSGKCVNKHHVMRRDEGVWYCPDQADEGPPDVPGFEAVRIMRLQPGDVIVIQAKDWLESFEQERLVKRIERVFPGHKAVILDGDTQISIARGDDAPR